MYSTVWAPIPSSLGSLDDQTDTRVRGSRSVVECYASSIFLTPLRDAWFVLPSVYVPIPITTGPYPLFFESSCSIYPHILAFRETSILTLVDLISFYLGLMRQKTDPSCQYILFSYYFFFFFSCKTTISSFYHTLFDSQTFYLHIPTERHMLRAQLARQHANLIKIYFHRDSYC